MPTSNSPRSVCFSLMFILIRLTLARVVDYLFKKKNNLVRVSEACRRRIISTGFQIFLYYCYDRVNRYFEVLLKRNIVISCLFLKLLLSKWIARPEINRIHITQANKSATKLLRYCFVLRVIFFSTTRRDIMVHRTAITSRQCRPTQCYQSFWHCFSFNRLILLCSRAILLNAFIS